MPSQSLESVELFLFLPCRRRDLLLLESLLLDSCRLPRRDRDFDLLLDDDEELCLLFLLTGDLVLLRRLSFLRLLELDLDRLRLDFLGDLDLFLGDGDLLRFLGVLDRLRGDRDLLLEGAGDESEDDFLRDLFGDLELLLDLRGEDGDLRLLLFGDGDFLLFLLTGERFLDDEPFSLDLDLDFCLEDVFADDLVVPVSLFFTISVAGLVGDCLASVDFVIACFSGDFGATMGAGISALMTLGRIDIGFVPLTPFNGLVVSNTDERAFSLDEGFTF